MRQKQDIAIALPYIHLLKSEDPLEVNPAIANTHKFPPEVGAAINEPGSS
jgi:hypothetical protein